MGADNRSQSEQFKRLVSLWLAAHGVQNEPRPYLIRQSQKERGEAEGGHLWKIPDVLVNTRSEQRFLAGEQVEKARREAEEDGKPFYFSVQYRQAYTDPGDSLVFTDLRTLGRVLQALQRLRKLEVQEVAA